MSRADQGSWISVASQELGSVLLQRAPSSARSGRSLLFQKPDEVIAAWQPEEVPRAIATIEKKLAQGFYLAGYVAYEAGYALEPALADLVSSSTNDEPLVWLGCYRAPEIRIDRFSLAPSFAASLQIRLNYSLTRENYEQQVQVVRDLIAAGETYQLNLTMDAQWKSEESAAELYERLLRVQPVPYAALLHPLPGWHVLSFSPELFLQRKKDRIRTRPMKGTAPPGMDAAEDERQAIALHRSEKDRAENVMIVDLLRNDLGRICETGTVHVSDLFKVERHPTVLQMTSTVEGRLRNPVRYREIFGALFPSGSVVGAPKIHAMRLLAGLEKRQRGVYTGAIGYISPHARAEFSVAIRTVSLKNGNARMGVGSGITFDSDPALEYAECMTKTMFLRREPDPPFELLETLLLQDRSYALLEDHLARMRDSAKYFGFSFDERLLREALQGIAQTSDGKRIRVRLLLSRAGKVTCTASSLEDKEERRAVDLLLWDERTSADNRFLRHKTTHRAFYDNALRQAQALGFTDCLFLNTAGEITEGAIHNVVARIGGEWLTAPLSSGVLPGPYRRSLLQQGRVRERVLFLNDLLAAEAIYLCNSVRGLRRVGCIARQRGKSGNLDVVWTAPALSIPNDEVELRPPA